MHPFSTPWKYQKTVSCTCFRGTGRENTSVVQHLLVESQQWKHKKYLWNMFKVDNKETRTTSLMSFWCLYFYLFGGFTTHCFGVSIVDFEQVSGTFLCICVNFCFICAINVVVMGGHGCCVVVCFSVASLDNIL